MPSDTPPEWQRPFQPRLAARPTYLLHLFLAVNALYRRCAAFLERRPRLYRWFTAGERASKQALFGCRMCGQCALPATGYACPMTCPKELRNGPCGGVSPTGRCEVHPELQCVWVTAFGRAEQAGHGADLDLLQRPVDHREWDRSSWVNYWRGRDEHLWIAVTDTDPRPPLNRDDGLSSDDGLDRDDALGRTSGAVAG